MKRTLLFIACILASMAMRAQEYFPEGTKWTEIRLDTLKYDSWYSKVDDEWVPNFETIEYYVKGEYIDKYAGDGDFKLKCVYTNGPEWTDSLTLMLQEGDVKYVEPNCVMVSVFIHDNYGSGPLSPALAYDFDWSVGKGLYYTDISMSNTTSSIRGHAYYGIIDEIKEGNFGGVRPLKYVDLDGIAPANDPHSNIKNGNTKGGRIIQGIGITEWNDGECLIGPPDPYDALGGEYHGRHYRSMLVHFERNGEVLYNVWPEKETTDDSDYLPFVELGKQWHVTNTDSYPYNRLYCFSMHKEVERNGKTYVHTCYADDEQDNHYHELLREENKRVYKYDEWEEKEYLVYDFSLKEGDTFTYELMTHYPVEWKVLKQGWLEDGPDIVSSCTSNPDGTLDIKYRKLRTWTVGPKNEESGEYNEMATWVECVGALKGMFAQYSTGGSYRLAYVERAEEMGAYWENNIYLPFSFYYDNYLFEGTRVHGCNLPTGKAELSEDSNHQLTYELEGDRLHVYGKVLTHGGPNNYAYFFEETTDDNSVRKLHFNIIEIEPLPDPKPGSDGMLLHATDFYVPGFNPNRNYYVIDNRGVEHPVINKTPQMAYRPFIEDDKVWAVKVFADGMPTRQWIEYYYLDGDTIVNGHNAKRMLVASGQDTSVEYVGAWYEQDKRVYFAYDRQQQFELLYDFTLSSGDTIYEDEYMMYVVNKMSGGIPGFKGMYYVFLHNGDVMNRWLEGVGSESYPYINTMSGLVGRTGVLLVCKTGDEIIYYNSEEEDPYSMGAKKHRFDFTHTIKTKPQTRGEEEEQSLYGEYNNLLLGINLEPLDEAYLVRITNESDQVVYEKTINAGSIVGLNIDISAFAKGQYTVTMENSSEVFTGEFETITTEIQEFINKEETKNFNSSTLQLFNSIYNLQGQRLNRLQKGLNIVGGRKVFVK